MTKTVFAHTPPGSNFPPFVNLSRSDGGGYTLTVRSQGNGGSDIGSIALTPENVEALATNALADLSQEPAAPVVTDEMVGRFLSWPLPTDFAPDCGISFTRSPHAGMNPTGTNLLHYGQAKAMLEHCINGPFASPVTLPVVRSGPDSLEREIQAKADKGPRVTPANVEAEISAEYSFTLDKALAGCPLVEGLGRVTIAVLVLKNGTKLVGVNYGAIDPAQHSPEMGAKEARAAAVEQVWPLLGFRLRDELARPVLTDADAAADLAGTPRPDNPTAEAADFLASVKACDLSGDTPCEACQ